MWIKKENFSFFHHHLIRKTIAYGIGNAALLLFPILATPLLTNIFSTELYGKIDLLYTSILIVATFSNLCLETALLRFYHDEGQNKETVVSSVILLAGISSIIVSLFFLCAGIWLKSYFIKANIGIFVFMLSIICIPLISVFTNILTLFRIQRKALIFVIISIFNLLLSFGLTIFFIHYTTLKNEGLFLGILISHAVLLLYGLFYFRKYVHLSFFSAALSKKMLTYSVPLLVPAILSTYLGNINKYFLLVFHGFSASGIYSIGLKISMPITFIAMSFRNAWIPYAFSIIEKDEARQNYQKSFRIFLIILFLVSFITIIFSRYFVRFISNDNYVEAVPIVGYVCLSAIFINLAGNFFNLGIHKKMKSEYSLWSYAMGFLVNCFLAVLLVPYFSLLGVSLSLLIGHVVTALVLLYFSNRIYKVDYDLKLLWLMCGFYLFFLYIWNNCTG